MHQFLARRSTSALRSCRISQLPYQLCLGAAIAGLSLLLPVSAFGDRDRSNLDRSSSTGSTRFDIDAAKWDREDGRLEVKGDKDRDATVVVVNAYDPAQVIGEDDDRDDGDWRVKARRLSPVPCRVLATQSNGETDERDVAHAPAECAPKAPGGSQPPAARANGPYAGTVDAPVAFSSAGSGDPSGNVAYAWSFGDGGTSSAANPSYVYTTSGTFTVTLTVTDQQGRSGTDNTTATIARGGGGIPEVSINSTSKSCGAQADPEDPNPPNCDDTPVPEQPFVGNTSGHTIVAINDLGMHCGDLDTRISSILPPFQVLLAQVILKGSEPRLLGPDEAEIYYSAVSNHEFDDPALALGGQVCGTNGQGEPIPCTGVYKTNFWDYPVPLGSYDAFYPYQNPLTGFAGAPLTPLAGLPFEVTYDVSLPVPNVENLYLGPNGIWRDGDETLTAVQQDMPGIAAPYASANPLSNEPQHVEEYLGDKPFFGEFPFGYVAEGVNWFEGAGIPLAAYDDFGRENAYPLVRVQATTDGNPPHASNVVATVDTVLPISGEASCRNCHADPLDPNFGGSRSSRPTDALEAQPEPLDVVTSDQDPQFGSVPLEVSVEWATDINLLRLHDKLHGRDYVSYCDAAPCPPDPCVITTANQNGTESCLTNKALVQKQPVVCQTCHYTPALDLAQLGPLAGAPYDPTTDTGDKLANGRNQLAHQTNSRVMHRHHGQFTDLFPAIDAPIQDGLGGISNQAERLTQLEESCYQCHPGTKVQCLRGAMFDGAMLCSDCHGDMSQVGADFSADVTPHNPGEFLLGLGNFYEPGSDQPRVPWANEPGCGSCHTGDAGSNATNDGAADPNDLIVNIADTTGNTDGIRLRQAFRRDDPKATPIVPLNTRFAENPIPESFNGFPNPGAGMLSTGALNPKLYRVSTGHGGVMCEGCHGATHAEFDTDAPALSNDDVTSIQLQGHSGTISECGTCHGEGWEPERGDELGGPHGMHVVGDTDFSDGGHEDLAEGNDGAACFDCHGGSSRRNSEGTVLSRAATDRTLRNEGRTVTVLQGQPVGCVLCHDGSGD